MSLQPILLPPQGPSRTAPESPLPPQAGVGADRGAAPNWGAAIGLGLLVAVLGGIAWGAVLAFTGYVFTLAALLLGIGVAAAIRYGAHRITPGLIVLAAVLTLGGVFLGDVVGITIAANREGFPVSLVDVIAAYPRIVAIDPGRALIGYFFGLVGAAAAAFRLYQEMKGITRPRYAMGSAPGTAGNLVSAPSGATVEVTARSATRAAARIVVPGSPSHTVEASYDSTFGSAVVLLDGQRFQKARVWGYKKVLEVPIQGTPEHRLSLKFYGATAPRIEVTLDGALLTTV